MVRPRKLDRITNPKTYEQRFNSFKDGLCPYCGVSGAVLEKTARGYRGVCKVCGVVNNFTKPDSKMQMVGR